MQPQRFECQRTVLSLGYFLLCDRETEPNRQRVVCILFLLPGRFANDLQELLAQEQKQPKAHAELLRQCGPLCMAFGRSFKDELLPHLLSCELLACSFAQYTTNKQVSMHEFHMDFIEVPVGAPKLLLSILGCKLVESMLQFVKLGLELSASHSFCWPLRFPHSFPFIQTINLQVSTD